MKSCGYCGRKTDDGVALCQECGTPFPVSQANSPKLLWGFPFLHRADSLRETPMNAPLPGSSCCIILPTGLFCTEDTMTLS